jgi:hypothetical protein
VERNTIVATASSGAPVFGGIRVRDGRDVIVAGNVVQGPWSNGIATTDLIAGLFEHNRIEGATGFGLWLGAGASFVPIAMTNNRFRANQATRSGGAGSSPRSRAAPRSSATISSGTLATSARSST